MGERFGGLLPSATTMVKVSVSVSGGDPLSATRTVTVLVLGPWSSVGLQLKTPVDESMLAPAGAAVSV